MSKQVQHIVTNKGETEITVHMEDGWHKVQPGQSVTGVLYAVNNGQARTLYRVEPIAS